MKNRFLVAFTVGVISSLILSCTPEPREPVSAPTSQEPDNTSSSSTATDEQVTSADTPSNLQTYTGPETGIPVMAQYPADTMEVLDSGSGEGVGVFFTFKPQGNALDEAEVSIFLPSNASSTDDLMPFITGDDGLIANNGWSLDGSRADTASEFPYPWFEMVFDISTDREQSGHILIGQSNGQAIQVTVLYPSEMADAFWPSANIVLDSLEFDPSLLPVTNSL